MGVLRCTPVRQVCWCMSTSSPRPSWGFGLARLSTGGPRCLTWPPRGACCGTLRVGADPHIPGDDPSSLLLRAPPASSRRTAARMPRRDGRPLRRQKASRSYLNDYIAATVVLFIWELPKLRPSHQGALHRPGSALRGARRGPGAICAPVGARAEGSC